MSSAKHRGYLEVHHSDIFNIDMPNTANRGYLEIKNFLEHRLCHVEYSEPWISGCKSVPPIVFTAEIFA